MSETTGASRAEDRPGRPVPPMPGSALWGWAGPLLVTAFGAFLRFDRLSVPRAVVFDETYYVPDAYSILRHGVEVVHASNVDALLARGSTRILTGTQAEYVAHPPLGKIMIAAGEWLFGLNPFGWRFTVALIGSLAILMTARIARRMTRSTLLGCVAGLLLALDGLEFVLSRTAILDVLVMFWVLAAFGLLVIDRDQTRARIAAAAAGAATGPGGGPTVGPGGGPGTGPGLGIRWPLVLAGACLGLACATKWNGVWYLPVFASLVLAWDWGARRGAGFRPGLDRFLRIEGPWLPLWFGLAPVAAYVVSWSGWFASSYGYDRDGTALNGGHPAPAIIAWLQYQKSMLGFGLGLRATHAYKSNPLGWLVMGRPTSFWSVCVPANGCGSAPGSTEQEVLAIGTPLIWWASCLALVACLVWWAARRDWRAGSVLLCVAAGWLPWIWFYWHDQRTEFTFYAVIFEPFLILAITLCLGLVLGPARPGRRVLGAAVCGGYLLAVLANFSYLYPVLAAQIIPFSSWYQRMWFRSWI